MGVAFDRRIFHYPYNTVDDLVDLMTTGHASFYIGGSLQRKSCYKTQCSSTHWTFRPLVSYPILLFLSMSASTSSQIPYPLSEPSLDELGQSLPAIITISLVIVAVLSFVAITGRSKIPLANPPRWNQIALSKRIEFSKNGRAIMSEARKRYGKQPYRLISDSGEILVLPPAYAATIHNETDLSFGQSADLVCFSIQ
jgi:hypothetical protein